MSIPHLLILAYRGTSFHGFQIQSSLRSVQGELWKALRQLDPQTALPQGTSRTDAGVHARFQPVRVLLSRPWDGFRLLKALNAHLPSDLRVMEAYQVPEDFFPRHHAVAKRYCYLIEEGAAQDPFMEGHCWHLFGRERLDWDAASKAADHFLGCHDFAAFRCKDCASSTTIRHIHRIDLQNVGWKTRLSFEGNRFLMHQIRIMVGTLVKVARHQLEIDAIPAILASRDRRNASNTAPAEGLYLDQVWFQSRWGVGEPSPWPEIPLEVRDES